MLKKTEIKVIREAYEESQGHSLRLTDDAISALVERDRKAFDELDEESQIATFAKAEEVFKDIAVSDPGITGMIAKMDDQFNKELVVDLDAIIRQKANRVFVYCQFRRIFTKATLDACPYPGTDADDVKGTNYKPDIVEKPALAGGKIRTVFTDDLVYAHPMGKAFQQDIDDAKKELNSEGAVPRFKGKSKKALKEISALATQGRNGMRSMWRGALELHHKLSAIEGMPWVAFEWIQGSNKEKCPLMPTKFGTNEGKLVSLSPKPLWFMPVDKETKKEMGSEGRDFSVSQVLAFDPAKALKMPEGGTLAELISTAKAPPVTPEQAGEKMPDETMDTTVVVIAAKLANTQARAALRTRALAPDNDVVRASYCAMYVNLRSYYQANEKWYDAFLEAQEAEVTNEKIMKLAASS